MSRYPQGIPSHGAVCHICGRAKYQHARVCRRCDPAFSSYSKAMDWAEKQKAGPCVVIYRSVTANEHAYSYSEWPGVEKGVAA